MNRHGAIGGQTWWDYHHYYFSSSKVYQLAVPTVEAISSIVLPLIFKYWKRSLHKSWVTPCDCACTVTVGKNWLLGGRGRLQLASVLTATDLVIAFEWKNKNTNKTNRYKHNKIKHLHGKQIQQITEVFWSLAQILIQASHRIEVLWQWSHKMSLTNYMPR